MALIRRIAVYRLTDGTRHRIRRLDAIAEYGFSAAPNLHAGYAERVNDAERILGFDVGERRVGIALSDALGMAQPLITMARSSPKEELRNIARLVRKHAVTAMVVGHARNMDGSASAQTVKCEAYAAMLRDHFDLAVHLQDERLSSQEAEAWLDARGFPRGIARKGILDRVAAMVILQDWLDLQARSIEEAGAPQ